MAQMHFQIISKAVKSYENSHYVEMEQTSRGRIQDPQPIIIWEHIHNILY